MMNTQQCIQELADGFSKGTCPRDLYVAALDALVRLAISEHDAAPALAVQAGMQKVEEIRIKSRPLR